MQNKNSNRQQDQEKENQSMFSDDLPNIELLKESKMSIKVPENPEEIIKSLKSRKKHMCVKKDGTNSIPSCTEVSVPGMVTQRS